MKLSTTEDHIKAIESWVMTVDGEAAGAEDAASAHAIVEALENARRSITVAIETWRAREVELVGTVAPSDDERTVLKVVAKPKIRWAHDRIAERVAYRSRVDENGESLDPFEAALRAATFMQKLYVSPATQPSKTGLALIGVEEPMSMTLSVEEGAARVEEKVKR